MDLAQVSQLLKRPIRISLRVYFIFLLTTSTAEASWMITPQFAWTTLGFQPLEEEPTENLLGYTFGLSGGYAPARLFEVNGFTRYTQLQPRSAGLFSGNTTKLQYGGKLGLRFFGVVYLGFSLGPIHYSVSEQDIESELSGKWEGLGYGLAVGGYFKIREGALLRVTLDYTNATMQHLETPSELDRSFDVVMINLSCVFDRGGTIQGIDGFFSDTVGRFFR